MCPAVFATLFGTVSTLKAFVCRCPKHANARFPRTMAMPVPKLTVSLRHFYGVDSVHAMQNDKCGDGCGVQHQARAKSLSRTIGWLDVERAAPRHVQRLLPTSPPHQQRHK